MVTRFLPVMRAAAALAAAVLAATSSMAQPVDLPIPPATTDIYPPGVKIAQTPNGQVYTDKSGDTLYGMDMRTLLRFGADPAQHCVDACAQLWTPLLAPKSATANIAFPQGFGPRRDKLPDGFVAPEKAPDWSVIAGPAGPQWVYKGWHLVFIRKGDKRGSTAFDGAEGMVWNSLKFVPPVPKLVAPAGIKVIYVDDAYVLADKDGHLLFTGTCVSECERWTPLAAGMASAGLGDWSVLSSGDMPQWALRGAPVFVKLDDGPLPSGTQIVRP